MRGNVFVYNLGFILCNNAFIKSCYPVISLVKTMKHLEFSTTKLDSITHSVQVKLDVIPGCNTTGKKLAINDTTSFSAATNEEMGNTWAETVI